MISARRKFESVALGGWLLAAMLAVATPAIAQTDLNQFVPRISFGKPNHEDYERDTDEQTVRGRPTYQQMQRAPSNQPQRPPQPRRQTAQNRAEAQASYQNSAARYQNQRYGRQNSQSNDQEERIEEESVDSNPPRASRRPMNGPSRESGAQRSPARGRGMYEDSAISRPPTQRDDRSYSQRGTRENANDESQFSEPYEQYQDAPASYESADNNDRGGNYRGDNDQGYRRGSMNSGRVDRYGQPSSGTGFGGFGSLGFGGMFGPLASRNANRSSVMSGPSSAIGTPIVMPEPVVTPDAVYLDAEPVKVGKPVGPTIKMSPNMSLMPGGNAPMQGVESPMYDGQMTIDGAPSTDGRSYLPGGPIMGRGSDGYTNPQCNDCCGGNCGGCCGGQRCGNNYGMYGGCEEGYDCCGGCGPNYGPWTGPYGRPWILAPLDFVFGGLWHCGPYHAACDPCANWWWGQDFTVFGGVHDFRSPVNIAGNSSFGFQEGINWAMPLWHEYGIGAQIGFSATQNNLQGEESNPFDDYRSQTFVTAGLFHRPYDGCGWQYGAVFDYLADRYYQNFNVGQVRGEIAWLFDCRNELGFWFTTGVMDSDNRDDRVFLGANEFSPIDQYAIYYRRRFCRGGEGRVWGGATGNSGGLVGADFRLPIAKSWAVETGFNYLISDQSTNPVFHDQTWNVGANLVWYWGCNATCRSLYRPLFNVADNGSFMVTRSGINGQ